MTIKSTDFAFDKARVAQASLELAKLGITVNDDPDAKDSKTYQLNKKKRLREGLNQLRDRAVALAEDGKTAEAERIIEAGETLAHMINRCDNLIDCEILAEDKRNRQGLTKQLNILSRQDKFPHDYSGDNSFGFGEYVKAMVSGTGHPDIRAALSEGTDSAGGYTVPSSLMAQVIDAMRAQTVVVQAGAQTVVLDTKRTTIARLASDPMASWRIENAAVAESDPTFDAVTFEPRSLACLVKVSRELLDDSINLNSALLNAFAQSMARQTDLAALFGSGVAPEPLGLFENTGINRVSMGTDGAALTSWSKVLDTLLELQLSNARQPTAMIMAPRTWRTIEGFVDTTGQPLRAPASVDLVPRLVTTQVPVDQTQGTAENATPIIMGDFSQMMLGVRSELRIEVLRETFASNLQYAFLAHLRFDVQLAQPKAFAVLEGIIPA